MPTQKIFKQRVRARMAKTGESYTAARRQLLRKATDATASDAIDAPADMTEPTRADVIPSGAREVSDEAMVRATGHDHAAWFALLDAWGATERGHTEIARWLSDTHGVPGWWRQSITVAYERARGMRARHQMRDGFSIGVTRTVAVDPARALEVFTSASLRDRWLPDAPLHQRPTRAALTARFDWTDPPSRVVVTVVPKGTDRSVVGVVHERLPDAATGEHFKGAWREWLEVMKATLQGG